MRRAVPPSTNWRSALRRRWPPRQHHPCPWVFAGSDGGEGVPLAKERCARCAGSAHECRRSDDPISLGQRSRTIARAAQCVARRNQMIER